MDRRARPWVCCASSSVSPRPSLSSSPCGSWTPSFVDRMSPDRPLEPVPLAGLPGLARRGEGPDAPTAILLHGYGGDEKVMWIFSDALPPAWRVIAFRGITTAEDGGYRWHVGRRWPPPDARAFGPAVEALRQAIPQGRRVLWIGFRQGAAPR